MLIVKIAVLAGGLSYERDVSLCSGGLIANALREAGHHVLLIDVYEGILIDKINLNNLFEDKISHPYMYRVPETEPNLDEIKQRNNNGNSLIGPNVLKICQLADTVFIALHGSMGENGQIQATFDVLGIKYTGTGYIGSLLAMDKDISKKLMCQARILTPEWAVFTKDMMIEEHIIKTIGFPCVVKPCSSGSSIGISVVNSLDELRLAILRKRLNITSHNLFLKVLKTLDILQTECELIFKPFLNAKKIESKILIERRIIGREFSVGILNGEALPVIWN